VPEIDDDFYSSDAYASKLIEYLSSRTEEQQEKPFFAYLPFSAPHWPLQAPPDVVNKYKGRYDAGPFALREARLNSLRKQGLVDSDTAAHPVVQTNHVEQWDALPEETRQKSARAMEVYAAMVDHMDANIGRVVAHLKATGEYDNTMILFMSDNGAEGSSIEAAPILGEEVMAHIAQYYDNSLDNIGRKNSFVWYGSLWAQAATAPSRLFKGYSTEGGCRVPLVVKPPRGLSLNASAGGAITKAYCTVMDVVPTFLDLAGLKHPRIYKDRQVALLRGASWKPFLEAASESLRVRELRIHDENYATGFECSGSGALIKGDWKVVFVPAPRGPHRWELFNVKADPGETVDLREREPEVFSEMMAHWEEYKKDVGVVGVANELEPMVWGAQAGDEFQDPYGWIKFMGRPDTVPEHLKGVVPV
jgi:arylsulfatase